MCTRSCPVGVRGARARAELREEFDELRAELTRDECGWVGGASFGVGPREASASPCRSGDGAFVDASASASADASAGAAAGAGVTTVAGGG